MKCDRTIDGVRCSEPGRWRPVLLAYALTSPTPARLTLETVALCDAHKAALRVEDIMTDAGWAQITTSFIERGFVAPIRAKTKLDWESV